MSLVVVGLNHNTSSVELREQLGFRAGALPAAASELRTRLDKAGVVLLSTCNRVEIYAHHGATPPDELAAGIRAFLASWNDLDERAFQEALYEYEGRDVAGHLFRVTSSLDSLVVGEAQILGQVHDAYLAAQTGQVADKVIHALFQRAFTVAKSVRTHTGIGGGNVSVSSVAVDLAASIFIELSKKTVMVIGAGEMSELTLTSLVSRNVGGVLVMNRNPDKARAMAESYHGEAVAFAELAEHLHRADIVISSTAAPRAILHPAAFREALARRRQEPMLVIDIAVPRDVDTGVGDLDNVYLYNIDDLEKVVQENQEARRQEAEHGMAIVERGVDQFAQWMDSLAAEPAIASMAKEVHNIRKRELEKTLAALPDLTEKQRQEVAYLTERIANNILRSPMTQIKHEIGHHDPRTVLHLVARLFGLEEH